MGVKVYKKTTAGRRFASVNDYAEITHKHENRPVKSLTERLKRSGGRNHHGVITSRFRGGGNKRLYRIIDFKRNTDDQVGNVLEIQYDPNRTCHIALIQYESGQKSYILAPVTLKAGDTVESGEKVEPKVGNAMPMRSIPIGLPIHNIEMIP
ncbi:MAG: 50S ribosomal protein L2, partial [Phycisphaerae bacterium]|nr:50S ribosomal protein L2 [Phycisphaerae bacterium]